jgi:hypothetical protein
MVPSRRDLADLRNNGLVTAVQPIKISQRNDSAANLIRNIRKPVKRPHRV